MAGELSIARAEIEAKAQEPTVRQSPKSDAPSFVVTETGKEGSWMLSYGPADGEGVLVLCSVQMEAPVSGLPYATRVLRDLKTALESKQPPKSLWPQ